MFVLVLQEFKAMYLKEEFKFDMIETTSENGKKLRIRFNRFGLRLSSFFDWVSSLFDLLNGEVEEELDFLLTGRSIFLGPSE
jgi:hypothetical protein